MINLQKIKNKAFYHIALVFIFKVFTAFKSYGIGSNMHENIFAHRVKYAGRKTFAQRDILAQRHFFTKILLHKNEKT